MKKTIISMLVALFATVSLVQGQKDVTSFLGIPVGGSKSEMIQKLRSKGFTSSPANKDVLVGEFNGVSVNIHIVTNNNKVCRIMVADANQMSEGDVKIRFNTLCKQFQNNKKYLWLSDYTLSDDEDISYGMSVKNKRYEAVYYQLPAVIDSVAATVAKEFLSKYTEEQLSELTKEEVLMEVYQYMLEKYSKNSVWFMISEHYGRYYITMFYDNEHNRANGEDL
ncbi:MAG: hypothetical protein LBO06_06635 [Bacteroidales bacterium]|nr:hypothetical protein [Bacteroidales bacterium]